MRVLTIIFLVFILGCLSVLEEPPKVETSEFESCCNLFLIANCGQDVNEYSCNGKTLANIATENGISKDKIHESCGCANAPKTIETTTTTLSVKEVTFPQKFHTRGNKIIGEDRQSHMFRGVNMLDPLMMATYDPRLFGQWEEKYFQEMANWGVTIVRIPVSPVPWRDTDNRLEILDQTIEWIGENQMYAIIDYHPIGFLPTNKYDSIYAATTQKQIQDYWNIISLRYRDNDVVAFYDIFNEPVNLDNQDTVARESDWLLWKDSAEDIIEVIRTNDPDKPIIVSGLRWAHDISHAEKHPISDDNIVYGVHPYPWIFGQRPPEETWEGVMKNHPVMATEFGHGNPQSVRTMETNYPEFTDEDTWKFESTSFYETVYERGDYKVDIINYFEENNISWVLWSFTPVWYTTLLEDWDYTPNNVGEYYKGKLRG